ncbi:transcriptional regulator [Acetobacter nitrogenifigens DSM 23921 = NBRC 105050]|uniref:LysR family transcriptional regulator n=1 Tax=Acetobacter nitrogenifigens DSM 23921 = NBRC 105050 TaxID=1120919 RepID=A0A511XAJ8_9PROT|nr:LysR family transcriptional regulator [Acetobacter nitrogenifigens]GBQ91172.1 transcriptional regulator [Acetobacter nitrogenifigens DSM 23921 = NBRC 105050]GEN59966.1 LysR family transcriptional regulator [Acetobacter nitrogenifigens DSM 23921 = NBRC 105050]
MLNDLVDLRIFARVALHGSLTAAARDLGLALNVVSKRLAALEQRTSTVLIVRSTRKSHLTMEGKALLERVQRILVEVDEAETLLAEGRAEPHGLLRIGAPAALGRRIVRPLCGELTRQWPNLAIDLSLSDRVSSLIDESLDVVIRIGSVTDSSMIARKLVDSHRIIVASPDYISRRGMPKTPYELSGHDLLLYGRTARWALHGPRQELADISVTSRLHTNSGDVAHEWARDGLGITLKSEIDVAGDLFSGRLVHVLPDWKSDAAPVCALYPAGRHVSLRLRVFLDAVTGRLRLAQGALEI